MIDVDGGNIVYYYHFDGLGSVAALSNINNVIVERYSYDVFGAPTIYDVNSSEISQSAIGNPYMFTARRADDETALYYYRARYYAFDIGRFLQTDPIGYIGSLNLYTYCGNNPMNWIDPYGFLNRKYTILETQKRTEDCIELVGEGYFKGQWKAFGFAGDFDTKHRYDKTDRFSVTNGFYDPYHPTQFMIWTLDPSQYGNYLAGRSTFENYGFWGSFGVKIAGHLDAFGLALLEYSQGKFKRPPWDEKASREMVNLGLEHAGAFDYLDTRKNDPKGVDVDFKHFIECK